MIEIGMEMDMALVACLDEEYYCICIVMMIPKTKALIVHSDTLKHLFIMKSFSYDYIGICVFMAG